MKHLNFTMKKNYIDQVRKVWWNTSAPCDLFMSTCNLQVNMLTFNIIVLTNIIALICNIFMLYVSIILMHADMWINLNMMLCAMFGWNALQFINIFLLLAIISPWKRWQPFIWMNLIFHHIEILCAQSF